LEKKLSTLPTNKPVIFICGTGARSGEGYDTVKLLAANVQAFFLDADIKFAGNGVYTIIAKK
jgi:rhodanese-related sulfurtransferase